MAEFSTEFTSQTVYEGVKEVHRGAKGARPRGLFFLEGDSVVTAASYDVVGDKIQLLQFPDNCRLIAASVVSDKEFDTGGSALRLGLVLDAGTESTTTTAAGAAFTNQPANDGIEIVSSAAADVSLDVTIVGTTQGTDTVVVETIATDASDGTTQAATVKTDWGVILAAWMPVAPTGTITIREASANGAITTLTPTILSRGVNSVASAQQAFGDAKAELVASGTSTKQIGIKGTDSDGTVIYDSQALTDTTKVLSNSRFQTVTEIYSGDLEATRTATVASTNPLLVTDSQAFTGLPIPLNFAGGTLPGSEIGVDCSNDYLSLRVEVAPSTANTGDITLTSKCLVYVGEVADLGTSQA